MKPFFFAALVSFLWVAPAWSQTLSVSSSNLTIVADSTTGMFTLGTPGSYVPPNAGLIVVYPSPSSINDITAWINGVASDFASAPVVSPLTTGVCSMGGCMDITKSMASNLTLAAHYEIVNNPQTGLNPDTAMLRFTYTNNGASPATVGLRVQLDVAINGVDSVFSSIDNGLTTLTTDTLYTKNAGTIPSQYWDYDRAPSASPTMSGMFSLKGNSFGPAATEPDAFEIGSWGGLSGAAKWAAGSVGSGISDGAVAWWWTGGGDNTVGKIALSPGQSVTFQTYYGLGQSTAVVATPTFTPTATATFTTTPTPTYTPMGSPTGTPTDTPTVTPTSPPHMDDFYVSKNAFTPAQEGVSIEVGYSDYPGNYSLRIYNSAGEHIRTLADRPLTSPLKESFLWDGKNKYGADCASGVYLICLEEPFARKVKKVLLIR